MVCRELRAGEAVSTGPQPPAFRLRAPLASEARGLNRRLGSILSRERPRIALTSELMKLTDSVQFSWFAASGICRMLPPRSQSAPAHPESAHLAARAALKFLFKMIKISPEGAKNAALLVRGLKGCNARHLPEFFRLLSQMAEKDHSLPLLVLEAFPSRDPSLLHPYAKAFSFLHRKAGVGPTREFASLLMEMGPFPGSARLLLDSFIFTAENMPIRDWAPLVSNVCSDWRNTLSSEVFRDNPD
ncbi:MAG TPA: hypothetical protein PKJ97_00395 [Candidatus Bilamarchaeaceae archaeon]|nr:hypothetical protein [Candidatus Bilamarchaeaceae archaeon]